MAKAFTRGGYSFRPAQYMPGDAPHFDVYPKGERSHWARLATLYPASDGACWTISQTGHSSDARASFKEACDLVMARLPREGS